MNLKVSNEYCNFIVFKDGSLGQHGLTAVDLVEQVPGNKQETAPYQENV